MNKDCSLTKRPKWLRIKEVELQILEMDLLWIHPELNKKCESSEKPIKPTIKIFYGSDLLGQISNGHETFEKINVQKFLSLKIPNRLKKKC